MKQFGWLVFGLLLLTACGKTLDRDQIAQSIQQDVIKQGGVSLKTVTCPQKIKPEAGQAFECIGETDTGYTFTIPVKQQNDQGTVIWDVPNAKGLLNLAKFETIVQESVQGEIGSRPVIRCGGTYKAVKPGQTFECAISVKQVPQKQQTAKLKTVPVKPSKPDTIRVTIDTERNVSWQRVIPGVVNPAQKQSPAATKATQSATAQTTAPAKPARPNKGSADDFLNQPGAADQF